MCSRILTHMLLVSGGLVIANCSESFRYVLTGCFEEAQTLTTCTRFFCLLVS